MTPGLGKARDPRVPEGGPVAILPRDLMPVGPQITNRDRAACLLPSEASGHQTPARFDVWLLQRDQIPCKHARGGARAITSRPPPASRAPDPGQAHARTHSPALPHPRRSPGPCARPCRSSRCPRGDGAGPPEGTACPCHAGRPPGCPPARPSPDTAFAPSKASKPAPLVGPGASGDGQRGCCCWLDRRSSPTAKRTVPTGVGCPPR